MPKIGILSDTHGHIPKALFEFFKDCDEIWHAGDWGPEPVRSKLINSGKLIRGVYGNIDGQEIRIEYPKIIHFESGAMHVCMLHIGGYPGHYSPDFKKVLQSGFKPDIMVCGHSHILKVIRDPALKMLHINPGAAGIHGFHKVCTAIRLVIEAGKPSQLEVWESQRNIDMQPESNNY